MSRIVFLASAITLALGIPAMEMDNQDPGEYKLFWMFNHIEIRGIGCPTSNQGFWLHNIQCRLFEITASSRTLIPRDQPCVPAWVDFYFLCADGWCEPQICFQVLHQVTVSVARWNYLWSSIYLAGALLRHLGHLLRLFRQVWAQARPGEGLRGQGPHRVVVVEI